MTSADAVVISQRLADARYQLQRAAMALRRYGGKGAKMRKEKADEMNAAARMIDTWIAQGEPRMYQ